MKAIIVGGGVIGLTAAWALAREGCTVELFEQAALPNPLASSFDEHRLIRHPYGDHVGYARMIDDAFEAWDLLWRDLGERLYAPTGTLALTGNGADWAARSAATPGRDRPADDRMAIDELPRRFPMLDTGGVERAFWIDTGGVLFAPGHRDRARPVPGAQARCDAASGDTGARGGFRAGKHRHHDRRRHDADVIIVAGRGLGRTPGARTGSPPRAVTPDRHFFDLPAEQRAAWSKGPMVIEKTGDVGLYLVPPMKGVASRWATTNSAAAATPMAGATRSKTRSGPCSSAAAACCAASTNGAPTG